LERLKKDICNTIGRRQDKRGGGEWTKITSRKKCYETETQKDKVFEKKRIFTL
jgi:hypothetical protein